MTVTDIHKDPTALTMTVASEWDAPIARVWQLWADPRKLERWWGPPTFPATVVEHDLRPGGKVSYFMTSPEGEQYHGWWKVVAVDEPHRLELEDGFADTDGQPQRRDADDAVAPSPSPSCRAAARGCSSRRGSRRARRWTR